MNLTASVLLETTINIPRCKSREFFVLQQSLTLFQCLWLNAKESKKRPRSEESGPLLTELII
ncbi:hypothetical protein D082_05160 [Synechocystis sp. PCC 6714]|nr:hypothetical protein D082_05160 [Synechocystis sp. PCC 6714]